jgi:predicted RNA-binding Zn ribbon-like protein
LLEERQRALPAAIPTKNGIRRWCSMQGCGSRAKARRQYARRQAAGIP